MTTLFPFEITYTFICSECGFKEITRTFPVAEYHQIPIPEFPEGWFGISDGKTIKLYCGKHGVKVTKNKHQRRFYVKDPIQARVKNC